MKGQASQLINGRDNRKAFILSALVVLSCTIPMSSAVWAQQEGGQSGNQNFQANQTGVAINGDATGSSVVNNENHITTGSNTNQNQLNSNNTNLNSNANMSQNLNQSYNQNLLQPVLIAPSNAVGGQGVGGNSMLVMPRNPLPLPNANLGRSNFGLQFGLQNNPGLSSFAGRQNALGWFLQAGLTIPFGKIPDVYRNPQLGKLDDVRRETMDRERQVFGNVSPNAPQVSTSVQGKVVGLQAYNYSTIPSPKVAIPTNIESAATEARAHQPKLLALKPGEAFTRPLDTGEKLGVVEVGREYAYLGHTRSGWIKILLPNGKEGWTNAQFEFIKYDYTEIDALADNVIFNPQQKTAHASAPKAR